MEDRVKATNWWVGRKKRIVGILGCGEPGKIRCLGRIMGGRKGFVRLARW